MIKTPKPQNPKTPKPRFNNKLNLFMVVIRDSELLKRAYQNAQYARNLETEEKMEEGNKEDAPSKSAVKIFFRVWSGLTKSI